jgi:TetR/AcrR family transcriptional repressor of mexCD-oprJ operon
MLHLHTLDLEGGEYSYKSPNESILSHKRLLELIRDLALRFGTFPAKWPTSDVDLSRESLTMSQPSQDERLLKALAVAFVDHPRATLKELAEAAGVSKATLHRFCGTRDNLVDRVVDHGFAVLEQIISTPDLLAGEPLAAMRDLIREHLAHREMLVFMMFQYRPETLQSEHDMARMRPYFDALDAFFLRCQQSGLLRIDTPAPVMTELLTSLIWGMVDAERRGRAAPAQSAQTIEQIFLQGAARAS